MYTAQIRSWITLCEAFRKPRVLYHGSKPELREKIEQEGLTAKTDESWQEFGPGVYLAAKPEDARQYGELVFAINLAQLAQSKLVADDHELRDFFQALGDDEDYEADYGPDEVKPRGIYEATWIDSLRIVGQCQYLGDIPASALTVVTKWKREPVRYQYRVEFLFPDGSHDVRTFELPKGEEELARRSAENYFDGDERGSPQIVSVKNVGRSVRR